MQGQTSVPFKPNSRNSSISRVRNDPRDKKFKSLVKFSAAQQKFRHTASKCTASEKSIKELKTAHDDILAQADEVDERFKKIDEESEETFQCLQMKHQQEVQHLKQKHMMEHRELKSADSEKCDAIENEYESILDVVTNS